VWLISKYFLFYSDPNYFDPNYFSQYQLAKAYYLQGDTDKTMAILEKITTGSDSFSEKTAGLKLLKQMKAM